LLEKGALVTCDRCEKKMRVVAVRTMPTVIVEQYEDPEGSS